MQWHLARRLQEDVGFCLGDGHSGGRVPHQTLLDELDEAFGAAFEARMGATPLLFQPTPSAKPGPTARTTS